MRAHLLFFSVLLVATACSEAAQTTAPATEPTDSSDPTQASGDESDPSGAGGGSGSGKTGGTDGGKSSTDGGGKDGGGTTGTGDAGKDAACATCGSELVASDPQNIALGSVAWHITVDATNVYVARNTAARIARVPKSGGTLSSYTLGHYGDILSLAEAGSYLYYLRYYLNTGYLDKVPKTGGTPTDVFTSTTASNIDFDNILVDGTTLWFAPGQNGGGARTIRKVDLATDQVTKVFDDGRYLAMNATHLFWMSGSNLMAAPKDGSVQPASIAFMGTIPRPILADGDDVWVGREGYIEITRIGAAAPHTEKQLNPSLPLAVSYEKPTPEYADASYVYVVGRGATTPGIYRVPRAGGAAELFATDAEPLALTGDATHVYWTNRDYEVRRKAK